MFHNLRPRSPSPAWDTPRAQPLIPSIRLTTATPVSNASVLTPRAPGSTRRVVPKKSLLLHEAPPPLPLPPPRIVLPLKDDDDDSRPRSRNTGRFNSSGRFNSTGRFKVFVEAPVDENPIVVKKKKSRAALDSIKWALGDRTNAPKESSHKDEREKEPRPSLDSDREKWKWTLGRGRKDSKEKNGRMSPAPGSQPSSIRLQGGRPPSPSPANTLNPNTVSFLTPIYHPPAPKQSDSSDSDQPRTGSLAIRAMRSVRSMARIGVWPPRASSPTPPHAGPTKSESKKTKNPKGSKSKGSTVLRAGGSGESWLIGAPSSIGSPQKDGEYNIHNAMRPGSVTPMAANRTSTIPLNIGGRPVKRGSTLSFSTISSGSGESVLPRDSLSTHAPSSESGSARSSFASSRRSSTATNSSGRPPSSLMNVFAPGDTVKATKTFKGPRDTKRDSKRDSKSSEDKERGRKRGSLAHVFEMARSNSSSSSTRTGNERERESKGSTESYGKEITLGSTFAMVDPPTDPFAAARESISFFSRSAASPEREDDPAPSTEPPPYVPGETPARRARPRPMSEQLLRARPVGIVSDEESGDVAITLVNAATSELSDLINRLDLSATPEASPAKAWSPTSPHYAPDPMPAFAMHKIETAIRNRWPDVPASVESLAGRSFSLDDSTRRSDDLTKSTLNGSIADLKSRGVFPTKSITQETSLTSLRPYGTTSRLRTATKSSTSNQTGLDASTSHTSLISIESPLKNRTLRGKKRGPVPTASTPSLESLNSLHTPIAPETRINLGMSGTMGAPVDEDSADQVSSDEPDSDIPDELQAILSGQSDEESLRSLEDTLSFDRVSHSPRSGIQSLTPSESASNDNHLAPPVFSITSPSLMHYDPHSEGDVDEPTSSDGEREDDTGKRSFDFTGELNKLNEGGARLSFVEQLEVAFKTPVELRDVDTPTDSESEDQDSPLALKWDLPNEDACKPLQSHPSLGQMNPAFKFGSVSGGDVDPEHLRPTTRHTRSDTRQSNLSDHEMSLMSNLDASMCALANLNLSLVHPSSASTLVAQPQQSLLVPGSESSPNNEADASVYGIANLDLSLIHPSSTETTRAPYQSHIRMESDSSSKRHARMDTSLPRPSARLHLTSLESDTSSKRHVRDATLASANTSRGHARDASEFSVSSFGSILNSGVSDPFGYRGADDMGPPPLPLPQLPSGSRERNESMVSIPSISSYGRIINPGVPNPFGFDSFSVEHRRTASGVSDFSVSGYQDNDASAAYERRRRNRKSTDSDHSTFYFKSKPPPLPTNRVARPDDSMFSNSNSNSMAPPPISFHNTSFGRYHHKATLSNDSGSSIAHAYGTFGASGGRAAWAQHRSEESRDSIMSDFSGSRLGRPGLGDKMLESAALYQGLPLTSITASPSGSDMEFPDGANRDSSYDSILDGKRSSADSDSLFEMHGKAASVRSENFFDADDSRPRPQKQLLFNKNKVNQHRRPLSVFSVASVSSSVNAGDDDTMISMLGGGHVGRKAIGDSFGASPCFKAKGKRPALPARSADTEVEMPEYSPTHNRFIALKTLRGQSKVSSASKDRSSLDIGGGNSGDEDSKVTARPSPFPRPVNALGQKNMLGQSTGSSGSRSRPTTLIFTPAPPDTPPTSDASASGSQSSIDTSRLSVFLDGSRPSSVNSQRIRARGYGHRRRITQNHRHSTVESIAEEVPGLSGSPSSSQSSMFSMVSTVPSARFELVNSRATSQEVEVIEWDDDAGGEEEMRYLALRNEALAIVQQSKKDWVDTDFSRFALASFQVPRQPDAIRAFCEHSMKTYTPLPLELCIRRTRTNSRLSPYGPRTAKKNPRYPRQHARTESMEQAFSCISPPALAVIPPGSPFTIDRSFSSVGPAVEETFKPTARQRVTSKARRSALGWSRRASEQPQSLLGVPSVPQPVQSTFSRKHENKENEGTGLVMSPSDSLRLSRPRPKGRPQSMLATVRV